MQALRWIRLLSAVACVVVATMGMADSANAGTYLMRSCNVPGERTATAGRWRWINAANTFANNDCASGGGFGINAGPMTRTAAAGVVLESPDGGKIAIRRVRLWMVARLSGTGSALFVATSSGSATAATSANLFGPPGGDTLTSPYVSPLLAADTLNYIVLVSCSGSTADGCTPTDTNVLDIKGVEVTLEEKVAPSASIDGGELMTGGPQSGVRALAYTAGDLESGVDRVSAVMGNTVVGAANFAAECAHADFAACPQARNGSIAVDTRKVPDGSYPLALRVTDAAGNDQAVQASTVVQVVNGAVGGAGRLNGSGASKNARLSASFAANKRSTLTVRYGPRVIIRGRLTQPNGDPIGDARLEVEERLASADARSRQSGLTTARNGTFSYTIARRATSRSLKFQYDADPNDTDPVVRRLRLRVKASSTLRVSLHGIWVRYRGRVLTRPLPRAGKLVDIQGRAPGGAWKTFAARRTSRRGYFSGTYRLRVRRPGIRLQFRVRIPSESGYPFVGHAGQALTRTVR